MSAFKQFPIFAAALLAAVAAHAHAETANSQSAARCVPSFDAGRIEGYRCTEIREGSRYARLGIKDGDVIRSIDGEPLADPFTALEKLGRLSSARHGSISLILDRDGHEISQTFAPESSQKRQAQVNQ